MIVISSRRFVESSNHHSQQPLYKEQISFAFRSWLTGCAACGEQSIICGRNLWGAQENTLYLVKILIHCFCEVSRLLFVCPALWPNRADVCRAPAHPAPWPAGMGEDGGYNTVNFSWRKLSLSNYIFFGLGAVDDYRTFIPPWFCVHVAAAILAKIHQSCWSGGGKEEDTWSLVMLVIVWLVL